ncbi:GNAT family N-acetyltransferase [Neobacillus sp. Marseille-QA0830]
MNIEVVLANIRDFDAVNLIVKEGQDEHSEALPHIFQKVDQVMPSTYFCELLEDPKIDILVAKVSANVVGFAVVELKLSPPFDSLTPRTYAYINDFGVKSTYRRIGIGKALFDACVEWSKNKGAESLDLNVWEFNHKAISFYESLGMKTNSRKMTMSL